MKPTEPHRAVEALRQYITDALAGRTVEDVSSAELAAIHDSADSRVRALFGIGGWEAAAIVSKVQPSSISDTEFKSWRSPYLTLDLLGRRPCVAGLHVVGDYAGDHRGACFVDAASVAFASTEVRKLLRSRAQWKDFSVLIYTNESQAAPIEVSGREPR